MNPIWFSAVVGAVLGHQRKRFRDGSTPEDHCPAKRLPRTPLKSLLAFLWGKVNWVRGSRATHTRGPKEEINEASAFQHGNGDRAQASGDSHP